MLQLAVVMNTKSERTSFQQQLCRKSCFTLSQVFKTVLGEIVKWFAQTCRGQTAQGYFMLRYRQTSAMPIESLLARLAHLLFINADLQGMPELLDSENT